jgi:hypothetical protein
LKTRMSFAIPSSLSSGRLSELEYLKLEIETVRYCYLGMLFAIVTMTVLNLPSTRIFEYCDSSSCSDTIWNTANVPGFMNLATTLSNLYPQDSDENEHADTTRQYGERVISARAPGRLRMSQPCRRSTSGCSPQSSQLLMGLSQPIQ